MGAEMNFDARGVKPNAKPDPVPAGQYRVMITSSEVKPTKDTTGKLLELELVILDGEYKGRKLWDRLNIQNANAQAQSIAQGQLSAICHSVGVLQLKNSSQLHNLPLLAKVVVDQSPGYDPKNEIKRYESVGTVSTETLPGATSAPAPAAAAPSANAPAWARKAG